jgi:hypothetical protein
MSIMSNDQRDISSTLRFMDDRALQQYAAMHKNDPYIFPLAFQESQNRQKLRMSQQAQMAQQPQPKVAEQALAQMAPQPMPEEMGIGALPAGNMEGMADGGIVGYEGYDETPRQFSQEPVMMMAEGGVARYQVGGDTMGGFSGISPEQEAALEVRAENEQKLRQLSALEKQATFLESTGAPQAQQVRAQANALKNSMGPRPSPTDPSFRRQPDPRMQPGVATTARPLITSDAAPKVDTGRKTPVAAADTASAGLAGIKDPAKLYQDILAKQEYKDPAADALLELEARERANAAAERQAIATDAERFKEAYKGREGRLAEREADIGKQKGQNTGLALLNAGLAIMSTPGGLATAIGKGAQVGTAQFASGLDKIRSAQERLGEARDRLDDLKLNREETTAKELRAAERNYRDVATTAQKRTIDGIRTAAGVNETRAKNIYDKTIDLTKTVYEQEQANKRTDKQVAAANRTPAEIQMIERIMKERNIPFSEALSFISGAKREGVSEEKLRGEWLDQAKRLQIAQDYPNVKTFDDYKAVMGMGGGGAGGFKVVGVR